MKLAEVGIIAAVVALATSTPFWPRPLHTRYASSKPGLQNPFGPELSDTTLVHFSDIAKDIAGFLQLTTAKAQGCR